MFSISNTDNMRWVCHVQESLFRMRKNLVEAETYELEDELSLNSLEFGSVIAKGCNAVVYEAREKSKTISKCITRDFRFATLSDLVTDKCMF